MLWSGVRERGVAAVRQRGAYQQFYFRARGGSEAVGRRWAWTEKQVSRRGIITSSRGLSGEARSPPGGRQLYSREERRAQRRAAKAAGGRDQQRDGSGSGTTGLFSTTTGATTWGLWLGVGTATGAICLGSWLLLADPRESEAAKAVQESWVGSLITRQVSRLCAPFVNPAREKLLPDWPPDYLNISPDVPCPHTLVLDLEETLVCSTWDRRYGWRHAKRPGVENFLREMAKYYEIVVYSPNINSVAEPVVFALDKDGCVMHRLYRDATHFVRGTHCKDLDRLNRDPRKIVCIDDDPRAVQLQPGNAVLVTPYVDGTDRVDSELEDLIPFLAALVNENVSDVPAAIRKFSDNKAATVSAEYAAMLAEAKHKSEHVRALGIGGFIRTSKGQHSPAAPVFTSTLTAKDIVGDAPPDETGPAKGRLWRRFHDKSKEHQENQKRKMEAWQKVMQKKEQQRRLDRQAAAAALQAE